MVAPLCPLDLPQFYNKIARMCETPWTLYAPGPLSILM